MKLLSREEFRTRVFARDKYVCVLCRAKPPTDAHHILDRKLWPDGGYYLANGASVCADCHWRCETTEVTVEEVRAAAGITEVLLPPCLIEGVRYDKWGNDCWIGHDHEEYRNRGPIFSDPGVQKVLKWSGKLMIFR